jgi:hypothetical protein
LGNTHAATKVVHVPAGGSALILTVRISSGVEEDSKGGCPNDVKTDPSGLVLSRVIC